MNNDNRKWSFLEQHLVSIAIDYYRLICLLLLLLHTFHLILHVVNHIVARIYYWLWIHRIGITWVNVAHELFCSIKKLHVLMLYYNVMSVFSSKLCLSVSVFVFIFCPISYSMSCVFHAIKLSWVHSLFVRLKYIVPHRIVYIAV